MTPHLTMGPTMRNSKLLSAIVVVAGLSAIAIGSSILFAPFPFFASTGVELDRNPTLMSDIRGLGALLLTFGVVIAAGGLVRTLAFASALTGAVLYLGYVFARVLSLSLDGLPDSSVLAALGAELVLGLACLFALVRYREPTAAAFTSEPTRTTRS